MRRNVPSENELLVGWWADKPQVQLPAWDERDQGPGLRRRRRAAGGHQRQHHAGHRVRHAARSTSRASSRAPTTGALVVVTFRDQTYEGLHDTMQTYGIVAALSLLLVVAFAAWQSGRLLAPLRTLRETADEITETDLSRRLR